MTSIRGAPIFKGKNFNAKRLSAPNDNSFDLTLTAGEALTGTPEDIILYPNVSVAVKTDQPGIVFMEQSPDGINWDLTNDYPVAANVTFQQINFLTRRFYRTRFVSTASVAHTFFRLQTYFASFSTILDAAGITSDLKRLCWETDTDWNKGTVPATLEVFGTGDAAVLQTKDNSDESNDIPYTVAGNYTPSNGALIEVDADKAQLKVQAGGTASFPFVTPSNYTLSDAVKLQILASKALLRVTEVVGHWHLNESSGSNAADDSGRGNDGTLTNMEDGDWVAAKIANGLLFGGTDEFVNLGDIADFERTDTFSIEFWFKTSTSGAEMLVSRQENSGNFRGWNVFIESGVITAALISVNGSSNRLQLKTNATFNDNAFHHCVVTYDGSSNLSGLNIFIDGADVATTNVTDALSSTISAAVDCQMSGRAGANVVYNGTLDEVVIYSFELSSAQVTSRFNSDSGTETLFGAFPTDNPTVINNSGFVFSTALSSFIETSVKPAGSAIQYHISSDNGVTFKYFDGAAWVVTDDSFLQSNTAAVVNTNIGTLAVSGTFKFRALLNSDGVANPELDDVTIQEAVVFSTTDNLFVDTKDASQIAPAALITWLTSLVTNTNPALTDIRLLVSNNGRASWLSWNGSAWVAPVSDTTRTDATSIADYQTNFSSIPTGSNTLDVRLFLRTSDDSVRPTVANINVTSDSGFELTGVFETNQFDSTVIDNDWDTVTFINNIGSGGSIIVKVKAANSTAELTAASYGPALSNGADAGVTGQFIQYQITISGDGSEATSIDKLCTDFEDPVREIVAP